MKNTVVKDLLREIKKNFGRFFSIFCIVMLGTAFFAGLRSSGYDMKYSADCFYDDQKLMDIRVISTLGLSEEDIEDLKKIEGVGNAAGGRTREVRFSTEAATYDVRTIAYIKGINEPVITEGRLPEKTDECLADAGTFAAEGYRVGDRIHFETGDDEELSETLVTDTFTITGFGYMPYYIDLTRGTCSIGDGSIDAFVLLHPDAYDMDYYTEAYVSAAGADEFLTLSDEYDAFIDPVARRIEDLADTATVRRYDSVYQEAQDKIADAKKEVEDGENELADAEKEIEDGKKEISDAEEEIAEKEQEIEDAKKEIEDGKKEIEDAGKEIEDGEKELDDAQKEIDSGRAELADAQAEVDKNRKDLESARQQYEDGLAQYNTGLEEYDSGLEKYRSGLAEYKKNLEDYKTGREQYKAGLAEYEENKAAFDKGAEEYQANLEAYNTQKAEFDKGKAEYEAGLAALEEAYAQLEAAVAAGLITEEEASAQKAVLDAQSKELAKTGKTIKSTEKQLEEGKAALDKAGAEIEAAQAQLSAAKETLDSTKTTLDDAASQLSAAKETLRNSRSELDAGKKQLDGSKAQLDAAAAQIASGETQLAEAQAQINENSAKLDDAQETVTSKRKEIADAKAELADAKTELADAEEELADGEKKLADGKEELEENRQKLIDAEDEYIEKSPDARRDIRDAKQKIADAEEDIADLEVPEWYVLDRGLMESIAAYDQNASRMDSLGNVFPVIFFLVAALVSLTAMTRMVDEQRMQIGTLKALGYSNAVIAGRYLAYAMLATLSGGIIGVAFGEWFLPKLIIDSYGVLYTGMNYCLTPVNRGQAVLGLAAAVISTGAAATAACLRQLRSKPAELMRPEAPKNGQRILLERIPFIWKKLGFTKKSSIRNLVRYKKRLVMTIIGVGGCMSLLLVGFGLHDSINVVAKEQFINIFMQDATLTVDKSADEKDWQELEKVLAEYPGVTGSERVSLISVDLQNNGKVRETSLYIPQDIGSVKDYLSLRDRVSGEKYDYPAAGAMISEKTAAMLGLSAGDEVTIAKEGEKNVKVRISAIVENYVLHYLFISPETYRELYGQEPEYNRLYVTYDEMTGDEESALGSVFMKYDQCTGVSFTTDLEKDIDDMLAILDNVVLVLIAAAGLLAFVVLYNLNSINITERRRELATLKVLGFFDGEVAWYVYRENVILTLLGCVFGIIMGTILHRFTIVTVEVDLMMFGRSIGIMSYIWSTLITILFAVIVNFVMFFSLKKIDMIESLKSVE